MNKRTGNLFSRLTLSQIIGIGLTFGMLTFSLVAVATDNHSLFIN